MGHVIKTMQDNLKDDPFFASYATRRAGQAGRAGRAGPEDRRRLLQEGGQGHPALDPAKGDYVPGGAKADDIVARILKKRIRSSA
jgi:3-hydroxyacyl-CoA dehydrogenase